MRKLLVGIYVPDVEFAGEDTDDGPWWRSEECAFDGVLETDRVCRGVRGTSSRIRQVGGHNTRRINSLLRRLLGRGILLAGEV